MTTEGNSFSLVNLGPLAKPIDTLIVKISSATGILYEPRHIKRVAKAKADAALIKAKSNAEITEFQHRTMQRLLEEEEVKQKNIEAITDNALPELKADADPSLMENDWVTNFFDKSRIISDEEMQSLWSSVLAGEANAPGTFSKRTVNFLGDLDKKDAELFQNLCSFGWFIERFTPVIFNSYDKIYNDKGLNFETLSHLDSIGLVKFGVSDHYVESELPRNFEACYHGQSISLEMNKDNDNDLPIGTVLLTQIGTELATVCQAPCIEGYYEYVIKRWSQYIPKEEKTEQNDSNAA